ncbi:hypothetical protein EX30DRAFT_395226 [Ascodesmis nigricans]|uniref:N-acetyltransferase domain-containing protein n=1 Tax=Ascodesmis nigricans TaxID=341454 RepID=A0A4V6RHF7_9PEZI|nr:hypothetical protein EX30DRAFT_395226 [Ascodesmis nigricans]
MANMNHLREPHPGPTIRCYDELSLQLLRSDPTETTPRGFNSPHAIRPSNWPLSVHDTRISDICKETADNSWPDWAVHLLPYIFCHAHTLFHPSHCYVLWIPSSATPPLHVAGYIVSTPNTNTFSTEWRRCYLPFLAQLSEGKTDGEYEWMQRFLTHDTYSNPETFLCDDAGIRERWPAHVHINLTVDWRGKGWGKKLIQVVFSKLKSERVRGVHLGVAADNEGAVRFYEKCGLRREKEDKDTVWMVMDLWDETIRSAGAGETLESK